MRTYRGTGPDAAFIVDRNECPLSGAYRAYLPDEIFQGSLSIELLRKPVQEERRTEDRFASTLVISASINDAVRLAREDISVSSPHVTGAISEAYIWREWFCGES